MKIALMGAGSVGTIIGALLSKGGEDIVLVDSYAEHVDVLNAYGARIVGYIDRSIPVHALLPGQTEGKYDLIISMTLLEHVRDNDVSVTQMYEALRGV